MCAKVYSAPIPWIPDYSDKDWLSKETQYINTIRELVRKQHPNDDLVGEILRWPRGDGYAIYVVSSTKPLELVWIETGDAWSAEEALIRGLKLTDVRRMVQGERSMREFFEGPNRFYNTLHVGDIVHYHNGFGQFVRCEVVENDGEQHGMMSPAEGKFLLKPIGLVGNWHESDFPRRGVDGVIHLPHYVRMIFGTELFLPNASNLWEWMDETQRAQTMRTAHPPTPTQTVNFPLYEKPFDPTKEPLLNLSVPPMSEDEEEIANLTGKLSAIRSYTEDIKPYTKENLVLRLNRIKEYVNE